MAILLANFRTMGIQARQLGGRTLFVAHRRELVTQAYDSLRELWPEATTGLFMGDVRDCEEHNIAASIQSIAEHLEDFPPTAFKYLVIDEAHHAAAPTYKRLLGYFRPEFVLGPHRYARPRGRAIDP